MLTYSKLFWFSFAGCVWVYAGYPALVWALARLRPRPVRRAQFEPRITVVIAAHNEQEVIERKVKETLANGYPRERLEIVVASDGSTDHTNAIMKRLEAPGVRFLALPRRGKVAALNDAVAVAAGDIIVFTDADVELKPGALSRLIDNFADPAVGGVTGRKMLAGTPGDGAIGRGEGLYVRFDEWLKLMESRIGSTVAAHGALHAIRRRLFVRLDDPSAVDDMTISMRVVLRGKRLVHEPAAVAIVEPPVTPGAEFARKVRVANQSLHALLGLGRKLWFSGFYSITLVSHKLLRYCVPVWLLLMLGASSVLADEGHRLWQLLYLAQVGFYAAALVPLLPGFPARVAALRPLAIPHYFCVANAAALVAWISLLRGDGSPTWTPGAGFRTTAATSRVWDISARAPSRTPAVS